MSISPQSTPAGGAFARIANSPVAAAVGFVWGLAEAVLFFIVPDVWVGFVALFARRWAGLVLVATVLGALVGTIGLWYWTLSGGPIVTRTLLGVPGVTDFDLIQVRRELVTEGPTAIALGWLAGNPIKVYAHEAALVGLDLGEVLTFVGVNRVLRIGLVALVAGVVATIFAEQVRRHAAVVVLGYAGLWLAFYALYLGGRAG
jgi:hypothetical protein